MKRNRETSIGRASVDVASRPSSSFPEDWHVAWGDEPYRYKFYSDKSQIVLDPFVPLSFSDGWDPEPVYSTAPSELARIGHMLFYACGLAQTRREIEALAQAPQGPEPVDVRSSIAGHVVELPPSAYSCLRTVPSGGALFPWELYVAWSGCSGVEPGIYHYDVAHHRLDIVRQGRFDRTLSEVLGHRFEPGAFDPIVFVSANFWKNFFKYAHGSVRLQAIDAGVVIGQLQRICRVFGYEHKTFFDFLDEPVANLLGFDIREECVQAVIGLARPSNEVARHESVVSETITPLSISSLQRTRELKSPSIGRELNYYSCLTDVDEFTSDADDLIAPPKTLSAHPLDELDETGSPRVPFARMLRRRRSGVDQRAKATLTRAELARLARSATSGYRNDLDEGSHVSRTALYCVVNRVADTPPGVYFYQPSSHELRCVAHGSQATRLQELYYLRNVNMALVGAAFFVCGNYDRCIDRFGNRGFRILNLEAGIATARLYLMGGLLHLGVHALAGFDIDGVRVLLRGEAGALDPLVGIVVGRPKVDGPALSLPLWV